MALSTATTEFLIGQFVLLAVAIIGAWAALRQAGLNRRKEIELRIQEQRKEHYQTLVTKLIVEPFIRKDSPDPLEVTTLGLSLAVYGSETTVERFKVYTRLDQTSPELPGSPALLVRTS